MDLQKTFEKVFGSYNNREIKKLEKVIPQIHAAEKELESLSDADLQKQFIDWKTELSAAPDQVDKKMIEIFAGIKTAAKRLVGKSFDIQGKDEEWKMVHYDVQLIGGIVIHQGKIAEMKTGEGKTLVCTLPVILNALTGRGVHVITVNDYLSKRDAEWMKPLYEFCGLSVGVVVHGVEGQDRKDAYNADITYGTNNEFGFDYLRDNMAQRSEDQVQRTLHYAIIDEVDSILIDEARTPLIISAAAEQSTEKYLKYAGFVPSLVENIDFNIDLKLKSVALTPAGITKMEKFLGLDNIYTDAGFEEVHHIENSLKAQIVFEKDRDYVVKNGEVLIVDEFTGRIMPGRRYSDGLHQALEAKERVEIQRESKTLATITFQNYFRLYEKLSGMTGTAETEAEEFAKIYSLDTLVIPTNKPIARQDLPDKIFKNINGKFTAIAREVKKLNAKGQPVLVGTVSIEKSEALSNALKNAGIPHNVLNAKQHAHEAEIVQNAGQKGAVTIATNMAGRGTDIKLGEGVLDLGGLAIIGTERHESRRIDNQLRGRAGRQGDTGFTQFFVSMTDDLMRRFGGEKMSSMMEKLGIDESEAIQNKMISNSVRNAQKKIESFHFDARKHVVQYDDVMNVHREKMYALRSRILTSDDIHEDLDEIFAGFVGSILDAHIATDKIDINSNVTEIAETFAGMWANTEIETLENKLKELMYTKDIEKYLIELLAANWQKKKETFPPEEQDKVSRYILLKSIDELWLEHINAMTNLRDRVSLSGYAQKDPVMEYKREAFLMFKSLMFNVRKTAITNLFLVQISRNFAMKAADYSNAQTNEDQIEGNLNNSSPQSREKHFQSDAPGRSITSEKLGKKYEGVGRNEECPCKSGKKFKKCHGKEL